MSTWPTLRKTLTVAAAALLVPVVAPGCSVGDGTGVVLGVLDVPDCWSGAFNLSPDFFGADPYNDTLTIRVQNGDDYAGYSDGLSILIDNVHEIRGDSPFSTSLLNRPLNVSIAPGVAVPGAPVIPQPDPAIVHITAYLQKSCPTQNVALYALESVSVDAQGNCNPAATGPYLLACNAPESQEIVAVASTEAGVSDASVTSDAAFPDASFADGGVIEGGTVLPPAAPVRHSTITFQSLFDGDVNESSAAERLTQANFVLYLADPRDACPGGLGPPPPCRGMLTGSFQFYFEQGSPSQPFPGSP